MSFCPNSLHIIFKARSSCCERSIEPQVLSLSERSPDDGLEKYKSYNPPKNVKDIEAYLFAVYNKCFDFDNPIRATTITIGCKWLGQKCIEDQYRCLVKRIKKFYKFHGDVKYYYCFEMQNNGNLHAHGVECYGDKALFEAAFSIFGPRNSHNDSYAKLMNFYAKDENKMGYWKYIHKEMRFPPIHNITKRTMKELVK